MTDAIVMTVSLLLLLIGAGFDSPALFVVALISFIVAMNWRVPHARHLLVGFWLWMVGVLLYLLRSPVQETDLMLGLPRAAWVMLMGVWILPLAWPVGFAVVFKKWLRR